MDITPDFNAALARHSAPPISPPEIFDIRRLDDFLQEAYRIRSHIASLYKYLRQTRASYLSTDRPSRAHLARTSSNSSNTPFHPARHAVKHLTDAQKEEIDASTKQLIRELTAAVASLKDAEAVRQQTTTTLALKKRARTGLGALGRWAAGGAITAASPEEEAAEERERQFSACRAGVLEYLQTQLGLCAAFGNEMIGIRIRRVIEREKSVLHAVPKGRYEEEERLTEQRLAPEQLQMFAQDNQDMLKQYEDSLDQVRHAEKSLLEISELQSNIVNNLAIQSEHIDMLIDNTYQTAENVGGGNKELKKAAERKSTARMLFYGTSAFCLTLVVWDLLI
ncbi:snare protein syntaxin-like protein 18/UFE1 [Mytilinidion resinicola]|uniref:Snare protein syntaxin-like protein 18/UFE1 n=1 Tax=Mytilinidion resinicola TaxID=574789 RepID=A0A6A6Y5A3_9PEZI|nr:snare protein syntaxin-like protein 18/UFE1 [Mytilinidion resinicola]KAF2803204.1 snare protein syntaxin-like protein 18/UFE1 [Mytilinidion resinicola]